MNRAFEKPQFVTGRVTGVNCDEQCGRKITDKMPSEVASTESRDLAGGGPRSEPYVLVRKVRHRQFAGG
jgi:hypothetical protein